MKLVIASQNNNKVHRLTKVIQTVIPNIDLNYLDFNKVLSPPETKKTSKKILIKKLEYYHHLLNTNVVCEDDVIEFKVKGGYRHIVHINKIFKNRKNQYQLWSDYLTEKMISKGRLIKNIGTIIDGDIKIGQLCIPLIVIAKPKIQNMTEKNILNNFIGPASFGKSFSQISQTQKDKYMEKIYKPLLTTLLKTAD